MISLVEEFSIDGKLVQVYENVLTDSIIKKWIKYYENSATFSFNKLDPEIKYANDDYSYFIQIQLGLKQALELFEFNEWVGDYLDNYDAKVGLKDFLTAYINILLLGDVFTEHSDVPNILPEQQYIACLIFINPLADDSSPGFKIGGKVIPNRFNTMIVFDGSIPHCAISPTDDLVRQTLYLGFGNHHTTKPMGVDTKKYNPWRKNIKRNREDRKKFLDENFPKGLE